MQVQLNSLNLKIASDLVNRIKALPKQSVVSKALALRARALLADTTTLLDAVIDNKAA